MAWKQLRTPNLDPEVYQNGKVLTDWYGWCLATVATAFGTTEMFPTAWNAWEHTDASLKHEDRGFPVGVYFPIWFSGYSGMGHVAFAYLNGSGQLNIWTSPYEHIPYFYTGYSSVDKLASGYGVTYVGWSEGIGSERVIEHEADPAPAPAPAPVEPAGESYTVLTQILGYNSSNDAANHLNPKVDVAPETYGIFNRFNGMVNVTKTPGIAGAWINPADNVAPAPAPAPAKPANIEYTKLEKPLSLVTNEQPTRVWDLGFADDAHATSVAEVSQGTAFTAFGKAQRTDLDRPCYFMTEEDFGQADQTGIPVHNQGINTVDLSPAPEQPTPAPEVRINVVTEPGTVTMSLPVDTPAPTEPESVIPAATPESIQYTSFMNPMPYVTNKAQTVQDYAGEKDPIEVAAGVQIVIAGTFTCAGYKYYRAKSSVDKGTWYGFPVASLTKQNGAAPLEPVDIELDQLVTEADAIRQAAGHLTPHEKAIRRAATTEGFLIRFLKVLRMAK